MFAGPTLPSMLSSAQAFDPLNALQGSQYYGQAQGALGGQYNAYQNAFSALAPQEDSSLQNYDAQSLLARNRAVGNLNARGLGNSLLGTKFQGVSSPISGQGSGALQQLAQQRLMGRNQLQQGFTNQGNQLNNELLGEGNNLSMAYQGLNNQAKKLGAQEQANTPGLADLFSTGLKLASIF